MRFAERRVPPNLFWQIMASQRILDLILFGIRVQDSRRWFLSPNQDLTGSQIWDLFRDFREVSEKGLRNSELRFWGLKRDLRFWDLRFLGLQGSTQVSDFGI